MEKYKLVWDLNEIKSVSKAVFAYRVKKAIRETAFSELKEDCRSLKKTADLHYTQFGTQEYLLKLFPDQAKTVFKWRSKTLDLKTHLTYKYSDSWCRGCESVEETVMHVMNCGVDIPVLAADVTKLHHLSEDSFIDIQRQAKRIMSFIDEFST